jgi:hypothetical protein
MLRFLFILFSITILWFTPYRSFAQDIIKKNNGEELKTKVVEIGDTAIKYKKFDDPEFYTYTLSKKEVKTIKYENGKTINPNKRSKESYLELRSAVSLPIGNYGSSNSNGTNPGFAQPGFGSSLEFGFKISRKFGLSADLGSFYNEYDKKSIDDELRRNLGAGERITTSYTRYEGKYLLFGFQHYTKLGKRFTWVNKISGGIMSYSKPEFNYSYNDSLSPSASTNGPVNYNYSSSSGHASNGVFGFKTSLWFKLSNRFSLTGNVEVLSSQQKVYFNVKSSGILGGASAGSINASPDGGYSKVFHVNVLNVGLGMIFYLRKKR